MQHEGMPTKSDKSATAVEHNSLQHYEVAQNLGDCYTTLGQFDKARAAYEKAASLAPDEAGPYVGLGVVALQEDQVEDAEIAFRVASRLDGRCAKALAGLAMVAQQKKDFAHAFEMYLKCLELDPDNLTVLLGLFQVSCQMGSFQKITYYLEAYLDSHPGDTSVMFSLAALYTKDGLIDKARRLLGDVLALAPDHREAANLLEELERPSADSGRKGGVRR